MLETIQNAYPVRRKAVTKNPVKLTALFYLKEALAKEQYEVCPDIIGVAKEFGAADYEVQDLLEDPRRRPG